MKIVFDHKFGAQEHVHVEHYSATLIDVMDDEIDDALNQGWLTDLKDDGDYRWYQCRSTRCNLSNMDSDKMFTDVGERQYTNDSKIFYAINPIISNDVVEMIYKKYCKIKKFNNLFHSEVNNWLECDYKMVYYDSENPIAWSKMRLYTEDSLETVLFAWDYQTPDLRVGIGSLMHEIGWAKGNGFKYVYLGPGYENGSIYKANIDGFEWWTGSEWSTNTIKYIELCKRDSKLETIKQLSLL
jgi:hypothetical protein